MDLWEKTYQLLYQDPFEKEWRPTIRIDRNLFYFDDFEPIPKFIETTLPARLEVIKAVVAEDPLGNVEDFKFSYPDTKMLWEIIKAGMPNLQELRLVSTCPRCCPYKEPDLHKCRADIKQQFEDQMDAKMTFVGDINNDWALCGFVPSRTCPTNVVIRGKTKRSRPRLLYAG
ncbi:MAG: hypothetical protein Q9221_001496 [Calogaya cf. arnoldii]